MAFQKVLHPETKRWMFSYDAQRGLAQVSDRGQVAVVDLTALSDSANVQIEVSESLAPGEMFLVSRDKDHRLIDAVKVVGVDS